MKGESFMVWVMITCFWFLGEKKEDHIMDCMSGDHGQIHIECSVRPPLWRIPDRGVRLPATGGWIRGTLSDSNTHGHKRVCLK